MTPVTERGRRTQTALLAAARTAFEERGFDDCRMNDIADAAGVSHGTVYTYFSSKEEILDLVVADMLADLQDELRMAADDPVERIAAANRRYLTAYRDNARLLQVVEQAGVTHPQVRERLAGFRRAYHHRVSAALERLQRERRVRPDLPSDVTATALCAMVEGFSRYWEGPVDDEVDATLTRLWVDALGLREEVA